MNETEQETKFNPFTGEVETGSQEEGEADETKSIHEGETPEDEGSEDDPSDEQAPGSVDQEPEVAPDPEEDKSDDAEDPRPTYESLLKKHPVSWNAEDTKHKQIWGRDCSAWAERNGFHFLGFCIESGDPLFKSKK
jgi:hypothetical protein